MEEPKILKTENLKLQIVTVETNNGFHSGSMQDEDSWLIALNANDKTDYALYEVSRILNDISDDTVELLRIWAGLNEYGRENVLSEAREYEEVPEYTHTNIIPFPLIE